MGGMGGAGGGGAGSGGGGAAGTNPHPLYPPLDLDTLPGDGGSAMGPYEVPLLPVTTTSTTIVSAGSQAAEDILAACQAGGAAVLVPSTAGTLGALNLGGVNDCDLTFEDGVVVQFLVIGSLPGPTLAPSHRIRLRGGVFGSVFMVGESTDLVLDGVIINNGAVPSAQRSGMGFNVATAMPSGLGADRIAVVNSIIRLVAVGPDGMGNLDGGAYLGAEARNVLFANNNVVTAGNRNSWGFRIGGGENYLLVDNTVRVSFHKLVRMNDAPVDYVYIKGGVWMRESTLTAGGVLLNDSFTQLGSTTDHVYVHDPVVYLLPSAPVSFGASVAPEQAGKLWEARNIQWHALADTVVSDAHLTNLAMGCTAGALCDYGQGTHTYAYDPALDLPADPWRALPTIADPDPDNLPALP